MVLLGEYLINRNPAMKDTSINPRFLKLFTIGYFIVQYLAYYGLGIVVYPMITKLTIPQFSMFGVVGYGLFRTGQLAFDRLL